MRELRARLFCVCTCCLFVPSARWPVVSAWAHITKLTPLWCGSSSNCACARHPGACTHQVHASRPRRPPHVPARRSTRRRPLARRKVLQLHGHAKRRATGPVIPGQTARCRAYGQQNPVPTTVSCNNSLVACVTRKDLLQRECRAEVPVPQPAAGGRTPFCRRPPAACMATSERSGRQARPGVTSGAPAPVGCARAHGWCKGKVGGSGWRGTPRLPVVRLAVRSCSQ
jgi:hypothetical protein